MTPKTQDKCESTNVLLVGCCTNCGNSEMKCMLSCGARRFCTILSMFTISKKAIFMDLVMSCECQNKFYKSHTMVKNFKVISIVLSAPDIIICGLRQ